MDRFSSKFLLAIPLVCLAASGCSTQSYEAQLQATLETWREESLYGYMPRDNALAGNDVNLQIPRAFKEVFNELTTTGEGAAYDDALLYPAGLKFRGYDRTYKAVVRDEAEKVNWAYYLYLGAYKTGTGRLPLAVEEIVAKLQEVNADQVEEPVDFAVPALNEEMTWTKIRVRGKFYQDTATKHVPENWGQINCIVDFYLFEAMGHHVIVATNVPAAQLEESKLEMLMPKVLSTLLILGRHPHEFYSADETDDF